MKRLLDILITLVICLATVGGREYLRHPQKHTQQAQCISRNGSSYWFLRPNGEVFEMYFDNPPSIIYPGLQLRDITYTDDNGWMRHFVKAQVPK